MVHVPLLVDSVENRLLGTVDAGNPTLVVDDGHRVGEEVFKDAQGLGREGLGPFAALALYAEQEGFAADFLVIGIDLRIVCQHAANAALARIGRHPVVDTVIHAHRMRHLFGQASLEVDMIVDDREVTLLQPDDAVLLLVHGRQRIGRILQPGGEFVDIQPAQFHLAFQAFEGDMARGDALPGVLLAAPGILRLRVADNVHAIDLDPDVLAPHRDAEIKPFAVLGKGTVQIPHMRETSGLDGPVDRTVLQQDLIARTRSAFAKADDSSGPGFCPGLPFDFKIRITATGCPSCAFLQRQVLGMGTGDRQQGRRPEYPC